MPRDSIFHLFTKAFKEYKPQLQTNSITTIQEIPNISQDKYIDSKICKIIRKTLFYKTSTYYTFDGTEVLLNIYHDKNDKHNKTLIQKILEVFNYYILTLNKLYHRREILVTLYLADIPKAFSNDTNKTLDSFHVNSGFSIMDSTNDKFSIVIYRKEELLKVLLHEMIHCWNVMFHSYDVRYDHYFIEKYRITVKGNKGKTNALALYESFTDILACYGHLITSKLFNTKQTLKLEDLESLIKREQKHMSIQANKVWNFGKRIEETHCFSYYVCKAAMFNRIDLYRKFISKNGLSLIESSKSNEAIEFLRIALEDEEFLKKLNKPIKDLTNIAGESLRMTSVRF